MTKRIVHYDSLNFERKLLSIFGFYSGKGFEGNILTKWIFKISTVLAILFIYSMIRKILLVTDDLQVVFEIFHILITETAFVVKSIIFYRTLPKLYDLDELLRGPMFNQHTEEQDRFLSRAIFTYKIFARSFQCTSWGAMITYSVCPLLDGNIWAIPIWIPLDEEKYKIFAQFYEIICFIVLSTIDVAIDCLSAGLLNLMAIQLDILNDNLRCIGTDRSHGDYLQQEKQIQSDIKRYILHYSAIIRFVDDVQEIFSISIFIQIFTSVVAICTTGIQMALRTSGTIISTLFYFQTMVIEIGMFCWFSQDIITKSSQIGESCYMSEWYTCSTSTKRSIFIIMERAKRVIKFRAGNVFEMSLATFVSILRNSYSYFAVLMRVYKN